MKDEIGATNFVTGAGGFLQMIFNGFFGVRVHLKHLEIKNPRLPENYTIFRTKGLSYLNSKFQLEIQAEQTILTFYQLAEKLSIQLEGKHWDVVENMSCTVERIDLVLIRFKYSHYSTDNLPANASFIVSPTTDAFGDCDMTKN